MPNPLSMPHRAAARNMIRAAEALENEAKKLRTDAENLILRAEGKQRADAAISDLKQHGQRIAAQSGYCEKSLDSLIAATASETGLPAYALTWHATEACRINAKAARARRNREILRLARRGLTNRAIADQAQVSPRTVSRVIAKALRGGEGQP